MHLCHGQKKKKKVDFEYLYKQGIQALKDT